MTLLCAFLHRSLGALLNLSLLTFSGATATEHLTSDISIISDLGKENLASFNAAKTQFLHLHARHNLPQNRHLFFDGTQLAPSDTLNILGLSFTSKLNWKTLISSIAKKQLQ